MSEPMGLREFGRWVGLSGEGVRKAIKAGRIPPALLGERTLSTGKKRPVILDPEAARRALGANTNEALQRDPAVLSENRRRVAKGQDKLPPAAIAGTDDDEPPTAGSRLPGKAMAPTQAESNAITAAYKARMAKLEYEQAVGKLVNAAEIEAKLVTMLRSAVTRVRGVPTKAKGRLPHLTVSDIETLEEMIDECLTELANYGS